MRQRRIGILIVIAISLFALTFLTGQLRTSAGQAPVASFVYSPNSPTPSEAIAFDASSSYSSGGVIVRYLWDFGDGYTSVLTTSTVSHSYPLDGTYTVQLVVTDNNGLTGAASAVISVNCVEFFRVTTMNMLTPVANVVVTVYTNKTGTWTKASASGSSFEIKYDNMTQPDLANNNAERFRNPGYTASILLCNSSNIGFDSHDPDTFVYFAFTYGVLTAKWPNNTSLVYTYKSGYVETHTYLSDHEAVWDAAAGTYVIKVQDIDGQGVAPTQDHPIIVSLPFPQIQPQYYLAVRTLPSDMTTIPGQGFYSNGTSAQLTAPTYVSVSSGTRYRFSNWDVDGTFQGSTNPIMVFMTANHTATAHYVLQYELTFAQTGLSADATGTVVIVGGETKGYFDLEYKIWVDNGLSVTYSYNSIVTSPATGKQFRMNGASGPSTPITVSGPVTVTASYATQYLVTFAQAGLDNTATGTVVTINGTAKTYSSLPCSLWVDTGSYMTYSYGVIVGSSVTGKQFRLDTITGPLSAITVTSVTNVIGNYKTQFYLTVISAYDSPVPMSSWFDSGSDLTASVTSTAVGPAGTQYVCTGWTGTGNVASSGSGSSTAFTITVASSITWNWKTQYQVTFDETDVGGDFTGTVASIDSVNYGANVLPASFWWDSGSSHSFSFASPLSVNGKQYSWVSTLGLSAMQNGSLTVTSSGSVVGNYIVQNQVTFDQVGAGSDFTGTMVTIDSVSYSKSQLPVSFSWALGSVHTFAFQSPLVVAANSKQYLWTTTTGLSSLQGNTLTVSSYGSIIGNFKTQYYLTVTSIHDSPVPMSGWLDSGSSLTAFVASPITGGSGVQYVSTGWAGFGSVPASGSSSSVSFTINAASTITWNWKTQYQVTFSQTGVGSSFTGTVLTVDLNTYSASSLPVSLWLEGGSSHSFGFSSPLAVNDSLLYEWSSTSGLTIAQNGTVSVSASGNVTGHYVVHTRFLIVFDPGVGPDWTGPVLMIDDVNYTEAELPVSFWWDLGSIHTFAFPSPLVVSTNVKQYVWDYTTGLSTAQSGSITVTSAGTIVGYFKTQYYLTLVTSPSGVGSPAGAGWHDAGAIAAISTNAFEDIVSGSSRYRFSGWTTDNMTEISDPTRSPTNMSMDAAMTVMANYMIQYSASFDQTGVGGDFGGTVVTVDLVDYGRTQLPMTFWFDSGTSHNFVFQSGLVVTADSEQFAWTNTEGLSTLQSATLLVSSAGEVVGNYKTQYYLISNSAHGSPAPVSGWFDDGANILALVTSPVSGSMGSQYVCTGWTGTGNVPSVGGGSSMTFVISQASSITWEWKLQYYLSVVTSPTGVPTSSGSGWYDSPTNVNLIAPTVSGYKFLYWDVDGTLESAGVSSITVAMSAAHTTTAIYQFDSQPPPQYSVGGSSASLAIHPPSSYFGLYATLLIVSALLLTLWKQGRKHPSRRIRYV